MQLFSGKTVTVEVITAALNLIITVTAGKIHNETGRE
jgi:hypothetical protein